MSYTNPSAYSNTYLQAFYDFTSGHYYNNVDNFDVSVWSSSNLGYENSYISDKAIMCDFEQSNDSIELIQEYGIDVELSSINSGMPPAVVATTGVPRTIASAGAIGNPSETEDMTNKSALSTKLKSSECGAEERIFTCC